MSELKPYAIEKLLAELAEIKNEIANNKAFLKQFKVESENLTRLKNAKKDLHAQIKEEERLLEEHLMEENPDFEEARHLELKLKNELKEKRLTLKANLAKTNTSEQVAVYNYQIKGEPIKMQVERTVKVYINGKEER